MNWLKGLSEISEMWEGDAIVSPPLSPNKRNQVIQAVTWIYPLLGGHEQSLKRSRFHHPKKVTN